MTVEFGAHLVAFYAAFGEPVTVAGVAFIAVFEGGTVEDATFAGPRRSLRCRSSDAASVAIGAAVSCRGASFLVRSKDLLSPDDSETRLYLERSP